MDPQRVRTSRRGCYIIAWVYQSSDGSRPASFGEGAGFFFSFDKGQNIAYNILNKEPVTRVRLATRFPSYNLLNRNSASTFPG